MQSDHTPQCGREPLSLLQSLWLGSHQTKRRREIRRKKINSIQAGAQSSLSMRFGCSILRYAKYGRERAQEGEGKLENKPSLGRSPVSFCVGGSSFGSVSVSKNG